MKTKNIVLGITTVLFAIGSAFASRLIVPPDYISVHYVGPNPDFKCTVITPACDNQSAILCKVSVVLIHGAIFQAQVFNLDTDQVYCTIPLRDSRGVIGTVTKPNPIDGVIIQ